ncbi:MAG: MiaB/RimO family radical SAM methylthiotransferase [Candidatus Shapirobacteria bacterium]|nr:MiaB/RimO family radical SAM methylthiotransferase [Candidatus Shapirobacteria bacterium]MDD3003266.1 MiaB/RimO family radical SAM methylthiotransferase [Candidatus Shapirobacteria bacterium]MDD4382614.1 MiaB/RimO family radical SAM methylthiotransferase [Candidatus Shapirobacteria bacterium]
MKNSSKTFLSINFGCRVNSAETNQWSQILINQNYIPTKTNPDIILINTCSITKKGDLESLGKVRSLHQKYPKTKIYVTGCANLEKLKNIPNVFIYQNNQKEELLKDLKSSYTPKIKDKFSHTHRFLLKIQSGCTQFCSYCIVPFKRSQLWSLKIKDAVNTVNSAVKNGYQEIIITGVNLDQYEYDFSDLIKNILEQTDIKLISFGSIPLNCINKKFIELFKKYPDRISNFLHIPIQSGSDKILKLMNRPYDSKKIINTFNKLKKLPLSFGTDIIVGFPTESDQDFKKTLNLCQNIGFSKIHCFRYSSRPNTKAKIIHDTNSKISKEILKSRSQQIRNLV